MKPYELTYIISSDLKTEEADNLKKEVEVFVQEKGGMIVKSEKTVPTSLAYPIKHKSSGFFVTLEFTAAEKEIKELKAMMVRNTNILRHFLIVKLPAKIMKARRTKKPVMTAPAVKTKTENSEVFTSKAKKETSKVQDIDKKLEEILSE